MSDDLRAKLELLRRERLHRQIGALEAALEERGQPRGLFERVRAQKLKLKIERLKAELNQPMLIAI